jgi:soluble lytic murein transglycosylase
MHVLLRIAIAITCIASLCTLAESPGAVPTGYSALQAQLPGALQEWSRIDSFPVTEALRSLKRGLDNYFNARYAAALESFPDEPASVAAALGDYLLFYRAKSNFMLERNRDALADFQRLESRYPDSPLIREALIGQIQVLLATNQAKAALAVLANPKTGTNSETLYYQAKALDMSGEKGKAAEVFLQVYARYPASKQSQLAQQYFVLSSPGAFTGARHYEARLQRAESLIDSGDYRQARVLLLALGKVSAPGPVPAERRSLLFGEVEYRLGRASAAIPFLRKVTAADPVLHAKALYLDGACLRRLDRIQDFLALRDRILKLYPSSPDSEELCYSVATYFDVNYDSARSREAYLALYNAFPKGKYAERALWKLALFSYFEKKYDEAAVGFWKCLLAYPNPSSASPAMYWMGRCYEKLGDTGSAKYLFQRAHALTNQGYYGQRAREAEISLAKALIKGQSSVPGIDFNKVIATCDGIEVPSAELAEPDTATRQVISRSRQLMAAGFPDLALAELRWGRSQHPGSDGALSYVMARIYISNRGYDTAIITLRRAFPDYHSRSMASLPPEIWDILFPVRHWGIISQQAAKLNIDPNLVLGLIRQESAFDENARSKANARGLMQILPSTGRKLARQAGIPRFNAKKLYQAETNIILGTRYFAARLQQYGKAELALAAYNAGDSRVDGWLHEFGNLDMVEFVEQIPFSETRGYVKQVLSNRTHYDLLTASSSAATR